MRIKEIISPGCGWDAVVNGGETLRIVDIHGQQGVDFICYNWENPKERYHAPNTIKAARNVFIEEGSILYSDYARPMMTVTADSTVNGHDTIAGCCSSWSNEMLYGVTDVPGCRENFLNVLSKYELGWRDIVPNINFFCNVPIYENGNTAQSVFVNGASVAGDYVELRAQMDYVLVVISNCPQVNNPCNNGTPSDILVEVL